MLHVRLGGIFATLEDNRLAEQIDTKNRLVDYVCFDKQILLNNVQRAWSTSFELKCVTHAQTFLLISYIPRSSLCVIPNMAASNGKVFFGPNEERKQLTSLLKLVGLLGFMAHQPL